MESEIIISIFLLILIVCSVSPAPRNMEADRFRDSIGNRQAPGERVISRGNAKNSRNIWLKRKESLTIKFCQYEEGFVSVRNILWSNDGWMDTVLVKMDGVVLGNFTTNDDTNWGFSWNKIHESGPVGSKVKLIPGEHTLTLEVVHGDRFGVEFDRIVLDVEGEQHDDGLFCPDKLNTENSSQPDTTDNTGNITDSVKNSVDILPRDSTDNGENITDGIENNVDRSTLAVTTDENGRSSITDSVKNMGNSSQPDTTDNTGNVTDSVKNNVDRSTFAVTTDENGRSIGANRNDSSNGTGGGDYGSTRHGNGNGHGSTYRPGSDEDQKNDVTQRRNGDDAGQSSENSTTPSGDVSECQESKENFFWSLALAFWEWMNRQV